MNILKKIDDSFNKDNRFYVYCFYDLDNVPFYIGKGCGDRYYYHVYEVTKKKTQDYSNPHKSRKIINIINKIGTNSFINNYIKLLHTDLIEKEAYKKEELLIEQIGRVNINTGPLTNLTPGGEFNIGNYPKNDEHRAKISETLKGHTRSLDSIFKQSKTNFGVNNPMYGKNHTEASKQKIGIKNSKPLTLNNIYYKSISEAAIQLNVSRTTISKWKKQESLKEPIVIL